MKTLAPLTPLLLCFAASLDAPAPPAFVPSPAHAPALVRQLGADGFETRERAARLLVFLGKASIPALREGRKQRDAEVRRRCARLLAVVDRPALEPRLQELLDGEDTFAPPLPGWEKFREVAGADDAARALYVAIYQADRRLLELLQGDPGQAIRHATAMGSKMRRLFGPWAKAGDAPAIGDLAGLVLVAPLAPKDDTSGFYVVNSLLYQPAAQGHLQAKPAFRRLVVQFFA